MDAVPLDPQRRLRPLSALRKVVSHVAEQKYMWIVVWLAWAIHLAARRQRHRQRCFNGRPPRARPFRSPEKMANDSQTTPSSTRSWREPETPGWA